MNYNNAQFETSAGTSKGLIPSNLPEICFSGHSNVGKSSLINRLLGRKSIARTSNKPGKTVTVNFFKCDGLRLADLPGYGFAKVSKEEKIRWSELMQGYFSSGRDIRLVFQLIDARHKPTADDIDMLHYLFDNGFPFVVVLTKIDKLNKTEREQNLKMLKSEMDFIGDIPMIPFSATTGEGNDVLRNLLEQTAE
jgi:GTP-binding protein